VEKSNAGCVATMLTTDACFQLGICRATPFNPELNELADSFLIKHLEGIVGKHFMDNVAG
jgi:hypothetical protein